MPNIDEMIKVMQAYKDGKKIEFKGGFIDSAYDNWAWAPEPCWDWGKYTYRIAPTVKKSVGYRQYLMYDNGARLYSLFEDEYYSATKVEADDGFIKWIDTEWQYEEFEEE